MVKFMTRQEQTILLVIFGLLMVGWAVKAYRASHPQSRAMAPLQTSKAPPQTP